MTVILKFFLDAKITIHFSFLIKSLLFIPISIPTHISPNKYKQGNIRHRASLTVHSSSNSPYFLNKCTLDHTIHSKAAQTALEIPIFIYTSILISDELS